MSGKKPWLLGIGGLLLFGACVNAVGEGSSGAGRPGKPPTTTPVADPLSSKSFAAEVTQVTARGIRVKAAHRDFTLLLAHAGSKGSCSTELFGGLEARIAHLLPVGSTVTALWAEAPKPNLPSAAYVYFAEPGKPVGEVPAGASINEQLIAEGNATLPIDRSMTAAPTDAQTTTLRTTITVPETLPAFDLLVAADAVAWENRTGLIDACRTRVDTEDNRKRELYGPDGKPGTGDDPHRDYPNYSGDSGGSHNGGGGNGDKSRFCRRHWFC
ncbi:hypothetical protein ACQP06_03910 [Nocardia sp. CA-136227]|uniref:hypothetical protein n=1 Tax=Nocardia sp. CA-136227 TaxID=3239979 RepID=UPI003D98EC64